MPAQVTDDFSVHPGNWLEFAGPIAAIVGPREPCGRVRLPFGGHAVASPDRFAVPHHDRAGDFLCLLLRNTPMTSDASPIKKPTRSYVLGAASESRLAVPKLRARRRPARLVRTPSGISSVPEAARAIIASVL